jgi:hypothetical protein
MKYLLAIVLMQCCAVLNAQVNDKFTMAYVRDVTGRQVNMAPAADVEGTAYIVDAWQPGTVLLKNGTLIKDVQLKFDLYLNKLYFQRDGLVFEFADTVRDFYLQYSDQKTAGLVYRSNYPETGKNNTLTFYELLVDGKISLLKHRYKLLMETKDIDMRVRKKYEDKQQYYAALPGNRIVKIKRDRKALMEAMPEYAEKISRISGKQNLKSEESLIELFEQLNAEKN